MSVNKAIFLGSKPFGLAVLRCLAEHEPAVEWSVLHADDANDGRSAIVGFKEFCEGRGIDFRIVNAMGANEGIIRSSAQAVFVCGWYHILPKSVLSSGPVFLGIHHSLLPKYRGGAPLVWALMNGDEELGSSLFALGEGMDDGDIYLQVNFAVGDDKGIAEALAGLEREYLLRLPGFWSAFRGGAVRPVPQDHAKATYCAQRLPRDGRIDWNWNARQVHNFVRAQSRPYPGAFTIYKGRKISVWRSEVDPAQWYATPGQVIDRRASSVRIGCGDRSAIVIRMASDDRGEEDILRLFPSLAVRLDAPDEAHL